MQISTDIKGFRGAFAEMDQTKENILSELERRLDVTRATVYNKISGRTKTTKLELPIIKAVFRKYGIEIN